MGLTHFDDAPSHEVTVGHIRGRWTMLGDAAGGSAAGVRRIELPAGGWSTPAHDHGRSEEIFFVLAGSGIAWHAGATAPIRAGDCIVYHPRQGAHTIHAPQSIDLLAFGTREYDEAPGFPRFGMSLIGTRAVDSGGRTVERVPIQFLRESELGAPPLPPALGPRPTTIVNLDEVEPETMQRSRIHRTRRRISAQAGSRLTGLQHVEVAPGMYSAPEHCHSIEEEIFVILAGEGVLVLGGEETAVRPGHVVCRPAATAVAHTFRAGPPGLTYIAYGTRDPGDVCYYPRSDKIAFRGVGVIGRLQRLDYWDGED